MTTLTMTTFVTLDGVTQAPGGASEDTDGGFACGGWVMPHFDDDDGRFMGDIYRRASAFLLGRRTYEIFASYWPKVTDPADPIASGLNRLPKYVASRTLERADWHGSTIVRNVVAEVTRLKQAPGDGELQVHGSADLTQTLLRHNLVDVFHILTFPVVVGSGKRLFGAGTVPMGLELVASRATGRGVVISTYRNAGPPRLADFEA